MSRRGRPRIDPDRLAVSPSGHKPTKFEAGRFVAWDGEGITKHKRGCAKKSGCGCRHEYALLLNSEGGQLLDRDGISTEAALFALTGEADRLGKSWTHVVFGLSYDANMILRDVRLPELRRLWKGKRVRFHHRFSLSYRPRKSLWVKDGRTGASVTLWDTFGFYQSPFVTAIVKNLGPSDPRLPLIRWGKRNRVGFTEVNIEDAVRYTEAEVEALVDLCRVLRESLAGAGLHVRRWDGAGAIAAALLEREGIKAHMAKSPEEVHAAALYAYAGGRIETPRYGRHEGPVFHGDIRSAYPFAERDLPSLRHGTWRRTLSPTERFALFRVEWDLPAGDRYPLYPFPFRSSNGAIYFPRRGKSWVWRPEFEAAMKVDAFRRRIRVTDGWEFVPRDPTERPFAWVAKVYKERERMKRERNAAEKALKLGLNSSYGKLAQNVGGTIERPPPFHQIEWAGWITSTTRARLYEAACEAPESVITLATDGIYSTDPLPCLVDRNELGGWETATHERMLIAQSGVYWVVDPWERSAGCGRKNADGSKCGAPLKAAAFGSLRCSLETCGWGTLTEHYRGFDEDSLSPEMVLAAWNAGRMTMEAASTRFVTLGTACRSEVSFEAWRSWRTTPRELDLTATGKRIDVLAPGKWGRTKHPGRGLVRTDASDPFEEESTPYSLKFALERGEEERAAEEGVEP